MPYAYHMHIYSIYIHYILYSLSIYDKFLWCYVSMPTTNLAVSRGDEDLGLGHGSWSASTADGQVLAQGSGPCNGRPGVLFISEIALKT